MFTHEIIDTTDETLPFKLIRHINTTAIIPRHWHQSFEISYTVKGRVAEFTIDGRVFHPKEGDLLLINSNEIHSIIGKTDPEEENLCLTIIIPYTFMTQEIPDYANRYYRIPKSEEQTVSQQREYQKLKEICLELFELVDSSDKWKNLKIKSLIYYLLYTLTIHFSDMTSETSIIGSEGFDVQWIDKVVLYIKENLNQDLFVSDIAAHFHLDSSYFSRKFKKNMNIGVKQYVAEMRVKQAYQMILNTNLSIQAISDQCGFPNHKALITKFKKKYQKTPIDYRNELKSQKMTKNSRVLTTFKSASIL